MAVQYSTAVRNAQLDAIETTVSTAAILKIFGGTAPADCATADEAAGALVTMSLPSDWMAAASSGTKAKSGTWQDTSADQTGTASHFRIYETTATTCHMQGTVTLTSGGGDIELDSLSITAGQSVSLSTFVITAGNA